ncbi:MAG TPA: dual specificity protein phosphatase family protein [Ardenticatenaceae bacterium]|nr:dual specificity protein phosphatase family protein [Ardenticatenaceae bacterium]
MRSVVYWIPTASPGRLAIVPRPRPGDWLEDEIRSWRDAGIDAVVSLLTPGESFELGLHAEAAICGAHQIEFLPFPVQDRQVPLSKAAFLELVESIGRRLDQGRAVAIHCRMGVGRSAMLAAAVLVRQGDDPERAFRHVAEARGVDVPDTVAQRQWVEDLAR